MSQFKFTATLERPNIAGAWTQLPVPIDVSNQLACGQIKVKGTINGVPFRSTLLPCGDGSHYCSDPRKVNSLGDIFTE